MKANYIVGTIVLIVLIVIGAGIYSVYKNRQSDILDVSPLPIPTPQEGFNATPSATPIVFAPNSQPVSGESDNSNNKLQIMEPGDGEYLTIPFRVRGYLDSSDTDVKVSILAKSGEKVSERLVPCKTTLDSSVCEFSTVFENINLDVKNGSIEANFGDFSDSVSVTFN